MVIDSRFRDRRGPGERRAGVPSGCDDLERRVLGNSGGRRAGDRRAALPYVGRLSLPEWVHPYESELDVFRCASPRHQADLEAAWEMLELQAGAISVLSALYLRFHGELLNAAARLLRDREEAEDVLQDVFSLLPMVAIRFDAASGSVGGLLQSITKNLAMTRLRRNARLVILEPEGAIDHCEAPARIGASDQVNESLDDLLRPLPLFHRQVLWLRYSADLPFAEIATVLGREHANVRQAHRRALAQLARIDVA